MLFDSKIVEKKVVSKPTLKTVQKRTYVLDVVLTGGNLQVIKRYDDGTKEDMLSTQPLGALVRHAKGVTFKSTVVPIVK